MKTSDILQVAVLIHIFSFTLANKTSSLPLNNHYRKSRHEQGCGIAPRYLTRIAGGRPARIGDWPWMVAILRQNSIHQCGGVLVTNRHVLSAAHCFVGYRVREIKVRLGEYDFSRPNENRSMDFRVIELRIHKEFNAQTYVNDIAILKIHQPTVFNSYIWPICLPPLDETFQNKYAIITGWGSEYYGGPTSSILMEVSVPVWSELTCVSSVTHPITSDVLCAGDYYGARDSCQGDSGGPLMYQLGNGRWVTIGIVSWGTRCGVPGKPGIYTRVNRYLDWILANAIF